LTAAERVFGADSETGDPVAEQDYEFGYDPIGNRIRSTLGKADRGQKGSVPKIKVNGQSKCAIGRVS